MTAKRNIGIDLLRMLSMLMVVILHMIGHAGGGLASCDTLGANYNEVALVQCAAFCAVDCFGMVSGYVGITSRYRYTNIACLWLQVVFWCVVCALVCFALVPGTFSLGALAKTFLPLRQDSYWYFSAYFVLFLFMPILNKAINAMTRQQMKAVIIAFVLFFSLFQVFGLVSCFGVESGYSGLWLGALYFIGAYLRKWNPLQRWSGKKLLGGYAACVLVTWVLWMVVGATTCTANGEVSDYAKLLLNYVSPTVVLMAVFLVVLFSRLQIKGAWAKAIGFFAPAAFGVYLIHQNPYVVDYLWQDAFAWMGALHPVAVIPAVLGAAAVIYLACSLLDLERIRLFDMLGVRRRLRTFEEKHIGDLWA